ncbi:MAG: ParA family protein, partial [Planctomycetia bacterium]
MRTLIIAGSKGGVGRTTLAVNLAAIAAAAGRRVLIVDGDPARGVAALLGAVEAPSRRALAGLGVHSVGFLIPGVAPNVDYLTPYEDVAGFVIDPMLLSGVLRQAHWATDYDLLVVDAPRLEGDSLRPLATPGREWLFVVRAEPLALRTLPALVELMRNPVTGGVPAGVVLTMPYGQSTAPGWIDELRPQLGPALLSTIVPYDPEVPRAVFDSWPVATFVDHSTAGRAYRDLADALQLTLDSSVRPAPVALEAPVVVPPSSRRFGPAVDAAARSTPVAARPEPEESWGRLGLAFFLVAVVAAAFVVAR